MEAFVQTLKEDLTRTCRYLASGVFFSFSEAERRQLLSEGEMFLHRLETMEIGFLTAGLLGGTGVGKSTLMNALAGKAIAAASDRRPHTDRILIYKHETVNPHSMIGIEDIPNQLVAHTSEDIRGIILCDLPDFDSIIDEHRQKVLRFLDHLDILVWVTSVEKYADGRFYEFLKTVPKAAQNFYFVLNKVDQCFDGESSSVGYEALDRVLTTFQEHIQENGINKPHLFTISAKEAFENESIRPWNQFRHLSREIFQQRDFKRVTAIKAANLDVEVKQYLSSLQKEWQNLRIFHQILDTLVREISERRIEWFEIGQRAISYWIDRHLKQAVVNRQGDISCLTGPGYGIGLLFDVWSQRFDAAAGEAADFSADRLSKEMATLFKQRIEWLAERLHHQRVFHALPEPFEEKIREALSPEILSADMTDRFHQVFSLYLPESKNTFRLFVFAQRLAYGVVFLLFFLAIGGEEAWRRVIETPGRESVFQLLVSMFHTLFSETGLAALGSLILINLFLGFRFFHRFRKQRKKEAQKRLDVMAAAAGSAWQEILEMMTDRIDQLKKEIQNRIKDYPDRQAIP